MPKFVYPDACPDCGNTLSRSRRRGWIEKVFARLFRIGIFRCHRCGSRFYSPPAVMVHAPNQARTLPHKQNDDFSTAEQEVAAKNV